MKRRPLQHVWTVSHLWLVGEVVTLVIANHRCVSSILARASVFGEGRTSTLLLFYRRKRAVMPQGNKGKPKVVVGGVVIRTGDWRRSY